MTTLASSLDMLVTTSPARMTFAHTTHLPQVWIGNENTFLEKVGIEDASAYVVWKVAFEHLVTPAEGFKRVTELLKLGYWVRITTFEDGQFPIYVHPQLGRLCDLDLLVPVEGGIVIERQPQANDQIKMAHELGFYGVLITL